MGLTRISDVLPKRVKGSVMGSAAETQINMEFDVTKRCGRREPFDPEKIHRVVEWATKGLSGVSYSDIEMNAKLQMTDGMLTLDLHAILTRSAHDLISLRHPNYQYVAARLALLQLVKDVHGDFVYPPLIDIMRENTSRGIYDTEILKWYSPVEIDELNKSLDHEKNWNFSYSGLQQLIDKYLLRDRGSDTMYETPQYMYMLIAMCLFNKYPSDVRLNMVTRYYHAISDHKINLPTPILCGVRTQLRQFASCCLIDVGDSLDSIYASDMAVGRYVAQRSGIGINTGRIRGIGSGIRNGEVVHTGQIPFLKKFEATVRCCTQNGVRGGSATVHYPFWHSEIQSVIVCKNNKGTVDNRVRKLDYSIQLSKLFYSRVLSDGDISLFSPHHVPGLAESFGMDTFDELYVRFENDKTIPREVVNAQDLFRKIITERIETGRVYIMNVDHVNDHSPFQEQIVMSNLCQEITLPTKPINHIDDEEGEIALCILSAINLGKIDTPSDILELSELAVRALDALIDFQDYPVISAELSAKKRRSLGIGFIGMAHYLAKNKTMYTELRACDLVDEVTETLQYGCLKAGVMLAKESGPCEFFHLTKYSQGILPIDTYKKDIDEVFTRDLTYDWEELRSEILEHGLRNSTYTAFMPSESSSVVSNATQGIDPVRSLVTTKKSKKGPLKQVVPDFQKYHAYYQTAWEMGSNIGYLRVCAAIQKYTDQSISTNQWFVFSDYENNTLPMEEVIMEVLTAYKLGIKTLYYLNSDDGSGESVEDGYGCDSGACAI